MTIAAPATRPAFDKWFARKLVKMALDAVVPAISIVLAILIYYRGSLPADAVATLPMVVAAVVLARTAASFVLGGPDRIWHYTSFEDVVYLGIGAAASSTVLLLMSAGGMLPLPFGLLAIDTVLYLNGSVSTRLLRRLQTDLQKRRASSEKGPVNRVRTLIVGAGDTANALVADVETHREAGWQIVGLVDDDPAKQGAKLRGHPVLGTTLQFERIIQQYEVKLVILTMPRESANLQRKLIRSAEERGVEVRAVPAFSERVMNGHLSPSRAITLTDLIDSAEVKRTLLARVSNGGRKERVLVTGGAGYIGSHVVRKLLRDGYQVRVLDNFMYGSAGIDQIVQHPNLELVKGDISSVRDVVSAVKDADRVIALAAIVGDPACGLDAEETLNLNYESTKVLVEACNFYGVRRLVFASSCSVYGASPDGMLSETSPLNPVSLYARTRIMSEEVIFDRAREIVPVILRLSTVFGLSPRMRFDLVVNSLTAQAVVNRQIGITGATQWRPFVHCADAASAFILAATAPDELVRGETFNVGSGSMNFTIGQVGEIVVEEVGNGTRMNVSVDGTDLRNYRVSCAKINERLNFTPAYDLRSGIREMSLAVSQSPELRQWDLPSYSNLKLFRDRLSGSFANSERNLFVPRRSGEDRRMGNRRRAVSAVLEPWNERRAQQDRRRGVDRRLSLSGSSVDSVEFAAAANGHGRESAKILTAKVAAGSPARHQETRT